MSNFHRIIVILSAFTAGNMLAQHHVEHAADFWVGAGAATCGVALAAVIISIARD